MNVALCVIPHHDHPVSAQQGYLCSWDFDQLRDWLTDLEQWWVDWEAHLDEYRITSDGQPHDASIAVTDPRIMSWRNGRELRTHGPDRNDDQMLARTLAFRRHRSPLTGRLESNGPDVPDVTQIVDTWSQVLTEEHQGLTQPASVVARLALLRRHIGWIAWQSWVDEMWADVRAAQRALAAALDEPSGPVSCGPCPYCRTSLYTRNELERWAARREQREPKSWDTERVQCTGCAKSWEGTEVARLRLMQEAG